MSNQRSVNRKGWGTSAAAPATDELVGVTAADTTPNYLDSKLVVGTGLTKTTLNPGANEQLSLAVTAIPASLQSQWIPAGAWTPDPANTQNALVTKPYGSGPGSTYNIYTCINFPMIAQDSAQYWYYVAVPPTAWASNQVRFKVHFIVEDAIVLPGGFRFTLGARRQNDPSVPSGAKTSGNVDYILADTNIPRYRYTAISSAITIASAVAGEGLALELTRGTEPISDESDPAYVVGVELHWV